MRKLFRYKSVNEFLWQELELAELYCCTPPALNDPFDCRIDWRNSLERAGRHDGLSNERRAAVDEIKAEFERRDPGHRVGVCCFTCKVDDHLMWAHYADGHRGVCLMYDIPDDYLMEKHPPSGGGMVRRALRDHNGFFFMGGAPIKYDDNAFYNWLTEGDLDEAGTGWMPGNALAKLFSSKAKVWAHEEEFRIITSQPGRLCLDPSFLSQVVFGTATSDDHRRLIERMAKRNNPHVNVQPATRSTTADFGITFP